jgi:myo-inositol-1(or 4)-monophosphatase
MNYTNELNTARTAALEAGLLVASYYNQEVKPSFKANDQPVTAADHDANKIIRSIIGKNFPNDGWLSEEDVDDSARFEKKRVWIVDPLDGTRDFIKKCPEFGVAIALIENHQPVLGVVYNPVTKELFTAVKGQGAFFNEKPMRVRNKKTQPRTQLLVSHSEHKRGEWVRFQGQFDTFPTGGCAYKMSKVARGDADGSFTLSPKSEWDTCAGDIVIREAGGIVSYLDGSPIKYNQPSTIMDGLIYCSTKEIHQELLRAVAHS